MIALLQTSVPSAEGVSETLRLLDMPPAWVVVLVVVPLFGLLAWGGYAREHLTSPMRLLLTALRASAFALLLLVLARPVRIHQREEIRPAEVLVLVDDSASMRRKDTYSDDAATRAGLSEVAGRAPEEVSRLELARRVLDAELTPLLERGRYRADFFGFSDGTTAIRDAGLLAGRGGATHLGSALIEALAAKRGHNVTDVVVLSDGRSNGGATITEAAQAARAAGIPVHTLVVGDTRPEKNALIELVEAPTEALEGDELSVTVRVRALGFEENPRVEVVLEELGEAGARPVESQEVVLTEEGERTVLVAPATDLDLRAGERRFRVSVPHLPGETSVEDNQVLFNVHVSPARMRVLYIDGYPRWEYRYLKNLLLRSDQNLDVQCFLLSATPDFPQESSRHLPPLHEVPTTREELLDHYDVVILGDVDPADVAPSQEGADTFLKALRQFVEAGGGLLFEAGEYANPQLYRNTPLADVLPVVLDPSGVQSFDGDTTREFRPVLENPLAPHAILRLNSDPEINRRLWEDPEEGLRGFYWFAPVERAKPGAEVLLRHPTARSPRTGENEPLLVAGYYPAGRTLFLGVDSTWMWRYRYGDRYHEAFWRNAIRWLALGRLKSGDRRYRIETTRSTYALEDRVVVEARVLDEDYRPSRAPTQTVHWSNAEDRPSELELPQVPGQEGQYRAGFKVDRPGHYQVWMEVDGQRVAGAEFEVILPSRETADPSPDPVALADLSKRTGGIALPLHRAGELAEAFPGDEERGERISARLEDAWDGWHTLAAALALLSVEWILRKRVELV
ncbi:MAG TPA: hypothetical protein ENJ09_03495 [Planctomycetes bacterium]|nr:hypothetical protein [Planctomycetota bacterium]